MSGPMGWCPSVLRPMPLDDGLMVRIRPWLGVLSQHQAAGLADIAEAYGAGVIELTNRANLQLRGLTETEYDAVLPRLEALGLARVDHTASTRVNITIEPLRPPGGRTDALAEALSAAISAREFAALPQKFGFLIDPGPERVLAEIVGDIRIEAAGPNLLVRPAGRATGRLVTNVEDAVHLATGLARWFIGSGAIGADGRGRMEDAMTRDLLPPASLLGDTAPNPARTLHTGGPTWLCASGGHLSPAALRTAAPSAPLYVTPFRALYLPQNAARTDLVSAGRSGDKAVAPAPRQT